MLKDYDLVDEGGNKGTLRGIEDMMHFLKHLETTEYDDLS